MLTHKRNLVFQGGSVKGIAYLGALTALRDSNLLNFDLIEKVAGTSAGAMTALAIALNYSTDELIKVLSVDVQMFLDDSNARVSKKTLMNIKNNVMTNPTQPSTLHFVAPALLLDIRDNLGLYPGKEIRDWLEQLIYDKTGIRNCTFEEFHNLRLTKPEFKFKDLFVVGFNLNTKIAKTFSWTETPKGIIADAIRISMGIPFLFSPYQYFVKGGEDGETAVLAEGYENDLWIDGGIAENYPIKIFDNSGKSEETLGFYLASTEEMGLIDGHNCAISETGSVSRPRIDIAGVWEYSRAVLESALYLNQQLNQHVRGDDRGRTIYIDTLDIGALDFNITLDQKNLLIQSGWDAAKKFVSRLYLDSRTAEERQNLAQAEAVAITDEFTNGEIIEKKHLNLEAFQFQPGGSNILEISDCPIKIVAPAQPKSSCTIS